MHPTGISTQRISATSRADDSAGRLWADHLNVGGDSREVTHTYNLVQGAWKVTTQTSDGQSTVFSHIKSFDGVGRRWRDETSFGFTTASIDYDWTGHRLVGRTHQDVGGQSHLSFGLNAFGEMVEAQVKDTAQKLVHRERLERDILGRVRTARLDTGGTSPHAWSGIEYDVRHALSTSWSKDIAHSTQVSAGSHQFATNASVANAAASISANDFNRSRAATIGSLQSVSDGANPIWEVTHSNRGHRITGISDAYNTWSLAHDSLGRVVQAIDRTYTYIMCRAMNRSIWNVVFGGFGTSEGKTVTAPDGEVGEVRAVTPADVAAKLKNAKRVVIVPGYGMAVAKAQHGVSQITRQLRDSGVKVFFGIHPVAGRMPGHMNVLLAEADIPYEIVLEMEDINDDFEKTDVVLVIGANDIVNPDALSDRNSPIYGMPQLEVWHAGEVFVFKRGMAAGYAGVGNSLFFRENTSMCFGDARASVDEILKSL